MFGIVHGGWRRSRLFAVGGHDFGGWSVGMDHPVAEPDGSVAVGFDEFELMADEQEDAGSVDQVLHALSGLFDPVDVANAEDLIEQEDLGVNIGGDGEGEALLHAAGEVFDGGVLESVEFGEVEDSVGPGGDLLA